MKRLLLILLLVLVVGCTTQNCPVCIQEDCPEATAVQQQTTDTSLSVSFIDVGQGDAQLIHHGPYDVLIDCGKNTAGQTIIDTMQSKGITSLDFLIMTHPDSDHIGGCDDILARFNVTTVIYNGMKQDTQSFNEVMAQIDTEQLFVPGQGQVFYLGDAQLIIMSQTIISDDYNQDDNQNSIVSKLVYNKVSFLFTGDCDKQCETDLLDKDINATVLKVAHHGSKFATSLQFLMKVTPEVAIIQVGPNSYGHPAEETLDRLNQENIPLLRNDLRGTITIKSNGETITY
jgi:competence protein ComEC